MVGGRDDAYDTDHDTTEMLAIEQRLLARGYGELPALLHAGGDFTFEGDSVDAVVDEALRYLEHQYSVDLAGARVLAAIGEAAVKAQAFDAIVDLRRGRLPGGPANDAAWETADENQG